VNTHTIRQSSWQIPSLKLNTLPDRKKRSPLLDGIIVVRQDEHPGQQDAI
jgi:hypothetical protein